MIIFTPFLIITCLTLIIRTTIALSSTNWLIIWLAIELNLISFIPIINISNNFQETEASVKYLLIQALGSRLLIVRSLSIWLSIQSLNISIVLITALIIKIGIAPCHIWYPSVITSIAWMPAIILSTWQKLAPLSVISLILIKTSYLIILLAGLNALTGGMVGLNQTHLRAIIAYSSITHIGWILALIYINISIPAIIYFLVYVILIIPIFLTLSSLNRKTLAQIRTTSSQYKNQYILLPVIFLSLGGLPPLTGFFPKWFTIYLMSSSSTILLFFLITGSLINLYFYLNIIFSTILSKSNISINWISKVTLRNSSILYLSTLCLPLVPLLII